jgi:hypothetical protein
MSIHKNHSGRPVTGLLILTVIIGFTLFTGLMHGKLTNRWGVPKDMKEAAARFEKIPSQFGDWRLATQDELPDRVIELLDCEGHLNATFVNDTTGEIVNMFIVLGPPGPISVHTPEVCYSSKDHTITEDRVAVAIEGPEGTENEFWALTLRSNKVTADIIRVYYGWGNELVWTAPYSPRISFGGESLLYKIQLAAHLPPDTDLETNDSCKNFLEAFVPALNPVLLAPFE